MDTSAAMRKATNDREKEEYRKTGKCFECGKQGHLAHVCPTKRNRQTLSRCTVEIEDYKLDHESNAQPDPEALATQAMKLSEGDRDTFRAEAPRAGGGDRFSQCLNAMTLIRVIGTSFCILIKDKAIYVPFVLRTSKEESIKRHSWTVAPPSVLSTQEQYAS